MSCRAGLNKIIPQEGSRGKCSQDRELGSWERTQLTSTPNPEISSVVMIQGWWEWLWGKDPQIPPPPPCLGFYLFYVLCLWSVYFSHSFGQLKRRMSALLLAYISPFTRVTVYINNTAPSTRRSFH